MIQLEGVPKRCFTLTLSDGKKFTICIIRQTWPPGHPGAYPKHPEGDWGPLVEISGVDPKLLRDLDLLDTINLLSQSLTPERAKNIQRTVEQGVAEIQKHLPSNLSLNQ
jgi:hypothetical protein